MSWQHSLRRSQSSAASQRTFYERSEVASHVSHRIQRGFRAKSIKQVDFDDEEEEHLQLEPYDPSMPKGRGEGLGLPQFLKDRRWQAPVIDPMRDAFEMRLAAGSKKKGNPKAAQPLVDVFKLKQTGAGPLSEYSYKSERPVGKPPKAVYVQKDRKELYDHKLQMKPFGWQNQKTAKQTLDKHLEKNKAKGELVDVGEAIKRQLVQKRDIMRNFDKSQTLKRMRQREPDHINPTEKIDEQLSVEVWDAFGRHLKKQLLAGKAILIPKFGKFTYTFVNHLQMGGLTNPSERDQQIRTPVFLVGKDFVYGIKMKPGIAGSWCHDIHLNDKKSQYSDTDLISRFTQSSIGGSKNHIIAFECKTNTGLLPVHDISYLDVALLAGNPKITRGVAKDHCELIFRKYADRAAAGYAVNAMIPHIGKLSISIGLCAVIFDKEIIEASRGSTVINYKERYHPTDQPNNLMTNKILERDRNKMYNNRAGTAGPGNRFNSMGRSNTLGQLKQQLDAEYEEKEEQKGPKGEQLSQFEVELVEAKPSVVGRKRELAAKVSVMERMTNKRPGSAYGARSVKSLASFRSKDASQKALSRFSGSIVGSAISVVPDLEPAELLRIAQDVEQLKTRLVQKAQAHKIGLRETLTSTKLQKLFQTVGYRIEISHLKALLKELNFNWNGASCSLMQLLEKVQKYTKNPLHDHERALEEVEDLLQRPKITVKGRPGGGHDMPEDKETLHKMLQAENEGAEPERVGQSLIEFIQKIFYNSGKSLHQIYSRYQIMDKRGKSLMLREAYLTLMREMMKDLISEEEIMLSYLMIPKAEESAVTWQEFSKVFSVNNPAHNVQFAVFPGAVKAEEESEVLKKVHEWMYKRQYDPAQAFERLLSSANRVKQRSLQRYELHKVAISEKIGLKESEIDFLFDYLTGYDKSQKDLHLKQWIAKVDEAPLDPLQQIRKVLKEKNLGQESVMKQLGLRLLDDPLDFKQFESGIKWFDPRMSDLQLQRLFTKLKDPALNKVPVRKFLHNLTGTELDTVDAQKWMFKELYERIYNHNKSSEFLKIMEKADQNNDGLLSPMQVGFFLKYITGGEDSPFSDGQIEKFVRQLPKDKQNKIVYVDFIKQLETMGNRNHNPIRKIVKNIKEFMDTNGITVTELLQRIEPLNGAREGVPLDQFTKFLQQKIAKERDAAKLAEYSNMIDIDKDGKICPDDLETCLRNMNSHQFFKNGGKYLKKSQFNNDKKFHQLPQLQLDREKDDQKLVEIRKQIEGALKLEGLNHEIIFKKFDTDKDGMLNFAEFSQGIRSIITINQPTLEKIFNIMDHYKIGMVDYDQFVGFLKYVAPPIDIVTHTEKPIYDGKNDPSRPLAEDSFKWQHEVTEQIRDWFRHERIVQRDLELTPLDVFKSFDIDFDGKVSSSDMKQALVSIVGIKASEVTQLRLDRLMKVLSFFKTDTLQPSDFERLLTKENPYEGPEAPIDAAENFKKAMGGALPTTDMHNWKVQAMQQIGQVISRKFVSCEDAFEEASQKTGKVNFEKFKAFIDKYFALYGFNMTLPLTQQLFGELDPHKKTYMTLKDWQNAFKTFNFQDQLVIEYKNQMQCIFVDCVSAFEYYRTFNANDMETKAIRSQIDFDRFCEATKKIATGRAYTQVQLRHLFDLLIGGEGSLLKSFGLSEYKRFFGAAKFSGNQRLYQRKDKVLESLGRQGDEKKISKVQLMQSFGENILSRLRVLVQQSGKSLEDIFSQFDSDGSGELSRRELRKALRAMNLGLTYTDIDEILKLIDKKDISNHTRYDLVQGDGKIGFDEFASKLEMPPNERRMLQRANDRLVLLKEQMILHMGSPTDAFRMFSKQKKGFLTFKEFEQLLNQLCGQSQEKMPKPDFTVAKDMFDAIDIGRDGMLDFREWTTTFQHLGVPESGHACQPEPQTHGQKNAVKNTGAATQWMGGPEHARIGACIAKNRHSLLKKFREHSTHTSYDGQPRFVTFQQAKKALDDLLYQNFVKAHGIQITDEKLACILEFGIIKKKLSSEQEKELPSFGPGYYEERPAPQHPYKDRLYDFTKLLDVYRDRYDLKVSVF